MSNESYNASVRARMQEVGIPEKMIERVFSVVRSVNKRGLWWYRISCNNSGGVSITLRDGPDDSGMEEKIGFRV